MLDFESTRSAEAIGQSPAYGLHGGLHSGLQTSPPDASSSSAALAHWLALSLDHVGRGMLLVGRSGQLLHANRLACSALASGGQPLLMDQGRLCARSARDNKLLTDAIDAALNKGLRRMLTLGRGAPALPAAPMTPPPAPAANVHPCTPITLAVLPIAAYSAGTPGNAVLISLPQSSRSKDLAVQIYAREHGCTGAETAVLEALLAGQTPEAIAQHKQVRLCTVRTQIGQLRLKTGSHTIRELLDRVATLPPMMVVVQ